MQYLKNRKYSILSKFKKYSFVFVVIIIMFAPFVFIGAADGVTVNTTISNPLGTPGNDLDDIPSFITAIIKVVLTVGVPVVVLAFIYSGFLFIKAQGNKNELETAKKSFVYTFVGAVLLLGAFVIANAIKTTVDDIKSGV